MIVLLLIFTVSGLFAQAFTGVEVTLPLSLGIVGGYEEGRFRGEIALHIFPLDYLRGLISDQRNLFAFEPSIVGKGLAAMRFATWGHHAFYAGVGMFGYIDAPWSNWVLGAGPALQYAWKIPSRHLELSFDFLLPVLFKDNYVHDPQDDFPSPGAFTAVLLIVMGPSVGISWTF